MKLARQFLTLLAVISCLELIPVYGQSHVVETFRAAEQGDATAQLELGYCYFLGKGVAKDEESAMKWVRKAADQGYAEAQAVLGAQVQNEVEKVKWFRKAAEQGHAHAQFNLGDCYSQGVGLVKNAKEAVKWYRKAAEQGIAIAQINLGECYRQGMGVLKNEVEAVKWFRKAAEGGVAEAQVNLGECYARGWGVVRNEEEAYKWILLASFRGDENAKNAVPIIEERLSPEQRAAGQRAATEWQQNFEKRYE